MLTRNNCRAARRPGRARAGSPARRGGQEGRRAGTPGFLRPFIALTWSLVVAVGLVVTLPAPAAYRTNAGARPRGKAGRNGGDTAGQGVKVLGTLGE